MFFGNKYKDENEDLKATIADLRGKLKKRHQESLAAQDLVTVYRKRSDDRKETIDALRTEIYVASQLLGALLGYPEAIQEDVGNPVIDVDGRTIITLAEEVSAAVKKDRENQGRKYMEFLSEFHEVDQILGKALGYPEAYPHVSDVDDGSVVTGDHTIVSLASEVSRYIENLRTAPKVELSAADLDFVGKIGSVLDGKADDEVQQIRVSSLGRLLNILHSATNN